MSFTNDLTEQYLTKLYDDFQKEHNSLLSNMKSGVDNIKEKDITKQITIINSIIFNIVKLLNLKKKLTNMD